jgi:hypothetical protein
MLKSVVKAAPVLNVVAGGTASLTIQSGPRIHAIILYATAQKTAATSGFTSIQLADVLGLLSGKVNTNPKRQHLAQELNEIQTAYESVLAAQLFDHVDNNFNAVADTTATYNSVACTTRTSTWVLIVNLSEPYRDSYTARAAFAWPTSWVSAKTGAVIGTANVQWDIAIPATTTSGLTASNLSTTMTSASQLIINYAVRAELVQDTGTGPLNTAGNPVMMITHWYRQQETYNNTTPVITRWPFVGNFSQTSIFSPSGSGDDVVSLGVLLNNKYMLNTSKKGNDLLKLSYAWNSGHLQTTAGDVAGANWPAADVFHVAFDFDDNPKAWLGYDGSVPLEFDITLAQVTAATKVLIMVHQVWRDALTS